MNKKLRLELIAICLLLVSTTVFSQETVPFQIRKSISGVKGDLIMTGNDIVGMIEDKDGNRFTDPNGNYNGIDNNGNTVTAYIDVDDDPTTFSSSEARLTAPREECSKLVYAGLYWSANYYMTRASSPNNFLDAEIASNSDTNTALIINNGPLAQQYVVRNAEFDNDNVDIQRSPVTSYLVVAEPIDGCSITNEAELTGNIAVLRKGGTCSLREKAVNAQNAGAVGVVIVNDNGLLPRLIGNGPEITVPVVSIGNDDISNANFLDEDLVTLLQSQTNVVLATLSTDQGDDVLTDLPLIDPRKQGPADFRNVKFKIPGGTYIDVAATNVVFDGYSNTPTNPLGNTANDEFPYVCYADVTSLLDLDNPFGTYTVADMNATQGFTSGGDGACGGWVLVAIYEDPQDDAKYISISDGFAQIFSGDAPIEFTYNGFMTPQGNLPVSTRYGVASLEGDFSFDGDQLNVLNTSGDYVALGQGADTANPATNFFNSSISSDGAYVTSRTPNSRNTQGFDIDIFDLPNPSNSIIGNGQTSAVFQLITTRDRFSVFLNSFSTTTMEPELSLVQRVFNADGTVEITGGNVELGDEIIYDLEIENVGNEDFIDGSVIITDILPVNTNLLGISDETLPPGVTYSEISPGRLQFLVPSSLLEVTSDAISIRFTTQLVTSCNDLTDACSDQVINTTTISYTGLFSGIAILDDNGVSSDSCNSIPEVIGNTIINFAPCQIDVPFCGGELLLTAGNGYSSYTWSGPGISTPIVTTSNTFQVPNPQTGVFKVIKEDVDGADSQCITSVEEFNVEGFSDIQNPILDYVNGTTVVTEDCNGLSIPQILLCGDQSLFLETNFDSSVLDGISWQRLSYSGTCQANSNDPCSLLDGNCTDANWEEVTGGNTSSYTVSEVGDYRILAEFEGGCVIPFYFSVFKNDYQPELSMNPIGCDNEGSVSVVNVLTNFAFSLTSGGPYTNTTGTFVISVEGDVTVYAIDTNFPGCEYVATINVPSVDPVISVTSVDPVCAEEFGQIEVVITDGTPPFTYILDGNVEIGPIVEDTITFDNVEIGDHEIQIIDGNQCENFENVIINAPNAIIEVSNAITPVTCGGSDIITDLGAIDLTISGGTGPYTYTLVDAANIAITPLIPSTTISSNPILTTATEVRFEGLNFGQYYIFVQSTDNISGCSQVLFGPYEMASPPDDLITNITVGPSCSEGIILDVVLQGGVGISPPTDPPPGFDIRIVGEPSPGLGDFVPLNDGEGGSTIVDANTPIRDHKYSGLAFYRAYTIEVRDNATNCIYRELISPINPPSEPKILNFTVTDVSCGQVPDSGDGEISFEISEYDPSVTQVSWEVFSQITNVSLGVAYSGTATNLTGTNVPVAISNFSAGQYYVIVRENGTSCPARQDFVIDIPDSLNSVPTNITPANSCGDNAQIIMQTDGGTPFDISQTADGYTYALTTDGASNPGVYPINNNVIDLGNVAGDFDIWVSDANGCSFGPVDVSVIVSPLPTVVASFIDDCVYDNNNVISVEGTGFGTLLYQLDDGTAVVGNIDNNNHQFIVATSGTYVVTITDESGCSVNTIVRVYDELTISAAFTTAPTCGDANGVITTMITAGAAEGALSYELQDITGTPVANTTGNSTGEYTGVPSGDYIVVTTDDGRGTTSYCLFNAMISAEDVIPITADIAITQDYNCDTSGEITVSNPTGGNGQYEYSLDAIIWSVNNQFTGLIDGDYTVYIRDSNTITCPVLLGTLTIDPINEVVDLDFTASDITCSASSTSITVIATGTNGASIFEYRISAPITTPWQTLNTFSNLEQGYTYTFEARTDDSCSYTEDYRIDPIAPLVVTGELVSDISCNGDADGIVRLEVSGGIPPYTFTSSLNPTLFYSDNTDGVTGQHMFTDIPAGSYEFLAQDSLGCSFIIPIILIDPSKLLVSVDIDETGTIIVNASGGTPAYAYQLLSADGITTLFPEQTSNTFDVDVSGEYVVKVLDVNGCEVLESITVTITNQNPIIDYADEILFCALIGQGYPVISIQDENGEEVDVSFTNAASIVWQRLDDISCNRPFDETCPTTDDSCSSDWFDFETGADCMVLEPGEYRVVITFANRVAQSTEIYYFRAEGNTLDVIENEKTNIHLYPNPANTLVSINTDISLIKVFDVSGKLVLQSIQSSFDISLLKKGVYFTEVETSKGAKKIIKLVKQ
ncbi:PA domain-containing protein [Aquimarina sp. Aq107]|uniref:PA domain-containing protein n=1 Tax=Aquimarina sp. Aq107 TaxID=1191912 RepID=UPI000D55202F|nr:PA domain-containing protein [Aquimarina sp. Aq107]